MTIALVGVLTFVALEYEPIVSLARGVVVVTSVARVPSGVPDIL
jgi:hypothetical protein